MITRTREATVTAAKVSIDRPEYPTEWLKTSTQIYGGFSSLTRTLRGVKEGRGPLRGDALGRGREARLGQNVTCPTEERVMQAFSGNRVSFLHRWQRRTIYFRLGSTISLR
jgi:hypothetical protein